MPAQKSTAKAEIAVIDDKLLIAGIADNADLPASTAEVSLVDVAPRALSLTLSFKSIGHIENLVGFEKLEKLCLDNNFIEEIVNLGHLKNLKWLDLSFNKIRRIQGLDQLKKLEDLSLYCNKISVVEGLDQCTNLQCLSLGNNRIDSLEQVVRLRQIRSLRMLTLANNPIESNAEYRMTVLAYVDSLHYLDYAMIDKAEKIAAKEQYHDELLDVEEKESVANEQVTRDKSVELYLVQLDHACILFAYTVFDDMFYEDNEIKRLLCLPGIKVRVFPLSLLSLHFLLYPCCAEFFVDACAVWSWCGVVWCGVVQEHIETFRVSFKALSEEYIGKSLERFAKKQKEVDEFDRVIRQLRSKDDAESTQVTFCCSLDTRRCAPEPYPLWINASHVPSDSCIYRAAHRHVQRVEKRGGGPADGGKRAVHAPRQHPHGEEVARGTGPRVRRVDEHRVAVEREVRRAGGRFRQPHGGSQGGVARVAAAVFPGDGGT